MKIYQTFKDIMIRSMLASDIDIICRNLEEQAWHADIYKFKTYLEMQLEQTRIIFIACNDQDVLGYATLDKNPSYGPLKNQHIPMIIDLNVFKKYQHQGVGTKIMDTIENYVKTYASRIQLGVGLHRGYGAAQKLYVKRGYVPDGSGVWYKDQPLPPYSGTINDDDLNLYMIKILS